ncbi:hypothetical protein PIROE2DRAFT_12880 [Piromyces sp. E2]|nr:hypothetical protein PIROE2DRAFT_12880 [Piromyces sp. E2]|eukprot:OUM61165.1 hypothetical protein PIROE2DRAFT_12880 [Piromyces sp. E2]
MLANDGRYYTNANVYNITQIGNTQRNKFTTDGTFFSLHGSIDLYLDTYYGENLSTGSVMNFEADAKALLKRMTIDNIYANNNGALVRTCHPKEKGANVTLYVFYISNIIHENDTYSATIISTTSGKIKIDYLYIQNVTGYKSGISYIDGNGAIIWRFSDIKNFHSMWPEPLFYVNNNEFYDEPSLFINGLNITNVYEDGVMFYLNSCFMEIHHSEFVNIHECFKNNDCNSFDEEVNDRFENSILYLKNLDRSSNSTITYTKFDHVYGRIGTNIRMGLLEIHHCNITNSYFEKGFLYYTNIWETTGYHLLKNLMFVNNTSKRGTFLYIDDVVGGNFPTMDLVDIHFINNTASNYGKISYVYDDSHSPKFEYDSELYDISNLKLDKNNFVTNPTHILFDNYDSNHTIVIYSGDRIEQDYSCNIYDDYGNKFEINGDVNSALMDDLVFYEISLKGKYDKTLPSKVYGSYKGHCFNNSCKFKNLRLVGNPGDYLLELKIVSFGQYFEFKENSVSLNVKIKECNEIERINQEKDGINIKSCYKPYCDPICNNGGECKNDNVCDCSNTKFKGNTCSERYKQMRNKILDTKFEVIKAAKSSVAIDGEGKEYNKCEYSNISHIRYQLLY